VRFIQPIPYFLDPVYGFFPEVVLSLLLTSFEFEDAGKSIKWRMSGIVSPVVEGKDHARSELPMILTRMEKK